MAFQIILREIYFHSKQKTFNYEINVNTHKRNLFSAKLPSTFYLIERGLNYIEDKVMEIKIW